MGDPGLPGGVNPLDFLHKLATQRGLPRPEFQQLGEQGLPHNKIFLWQCSFHNVIAQASGRSKKEAKVAAARAVRDQLNFNELPPPPTYQSVMERKKRKLDSDGIIVGGVAMGPEGAELKKQRKYDYSRHFQCYGGPQASMMRLPYGYLPDRHLNNGPMDMETAAAMEFYNYDTLMAVEEHTPDPMVLVDADPSSAAAMTKGFMSRLSKLDRYVIKRHTEIYPSEAQLSAVLKLVSDVEEKMKHVSQDWNDAADNSNKIEGMVRVGDLSKGLLLAQDRSVSLVLLSTASPCKTMLQQIHVNLRAKMKELDSQHETRLLEKEAAFAVSKPLTDVAQEAVSADSTSDCIFCYVTFTSTALRKNPQASDADTEEGMEIKKESSEDAPTSAVVVSEDVKLPTDKCLLALAELRHSRWFAARAANLPSCVECIRIMRDLTRRDPIWSPLSDWAVELLVERALYSAWRPLNPAASLMRVMEVIAAGLLFEATEVFKDPCEREEVSPIGHLGNQEKEDITKSAQYYLRLMHFRQIYKVLGIQMDEPDEGKEEDAVTASMEENEAMVSE